MTAWKGAPIIMKKVVLYIIITAVCFATMEVALKLAGNSLDSFQLTFLRFLIGGLILAPVGVMELRQREYHLTFQDLQWLLFVGIVGIPISMCSFQIGVLNCNAATAAPLICTNPLFTMVIAHLITEEKMDRRKWIAFGIGLLAIVFMIRPWDVQPGNTVFGMCVMMFASVTFALYTVMGKRSIGRIGTFAQTSISFILGSLVLLVIMLIAGRPVMAGVAANWQAVAYCGIVVTGIGYMFYFMAIRASDATTGSLAFFIKPAIAPIFAILILYESIYWNTVVGIILLILASGITLRDTFEKRRTAGKKA